MLFVFSASEFGLEFGTCGMDGLGASGNDQVKERDGQVWIERVVQHYLLRDHSQTDPGEELPNLAPIGDLRINDSLVKCFRRLPNVVPHDAQG